MNKKVFKSIKEIPKEAVEMIDDVPWWFIIPGTEYMTIELDERLSSADVVNIANYLLEDGKFLPKLYSYIEKEEFEDRTYGINLYKKIHGVK